jgi:hypothetical protein
MKEMKHMDLATWMHIHKVNDQMLADAIAKARPYINRIRSGGVHPNLGTALDIWNYTRREIALEQLLPKAMRPKITPPVQTPAPVLGRPRKPPAPTVSKSHAAA